MAEKVNGKKEDFVDEMVEEKGSIRRMEQENVKQEEVKDLEVALREKRWKRKRRTWGHER